MIEFQKKSSWNYSSGWSAGNLVLMCSWFIFMKNFKQPQLVTSDKSGVQYLIKDQRLALDSLPPIVSSLPLTPTPLCVQTHWFPLSERKMLLRSDWFVQLICHRLWWQFSQKDRGTFVPQFSFDKWSKRITKAKNSISGTFEMSLLLNEHYQRKHFDLCVYSSLL